MKKLKKPMVLGFTLMSVGLCIGMILRDWNMTMKICGGIGLACIGIAALLNGAFVSGDRNRLNHTFETEEDNSEKKKITNFVLIAGLPNIILALIFYFM